MSCLSPASVVMHVLGMQCIAIASASSEDEERPDRPKRPKRKTRRRSRRGWVRIRDIERPKIHTPPQPRLLANSLWPFSGMIGTLVLQLRRLGVSCKFSMLKLHPLAGVHSIFFMLHFCRCILPISGIDAASTLQQS